MDTKRLMIAMGLSLLLIVGWQQFLHYMAVKNNWQMPGQQTAQTAPPTSAPAAPATNIAQATNAAPATAGAPIALTTSPAEVAGIHPAPTPQPPQSIELGSGKKNDTRFSLQLSIDPRGAGLKSAVLNQFMKAVKSSQLYTFEEPYLQHMDQSRPLATRSVVIDGQTVDLTNVDWKLDRQSTDSTATYSVDLIQQGKPVATIRKTYTVFPIDLERKGYEISVVQSIENLTSRPLTVKTAINGMVPPPQENEAVDDRQVIAGYVKDSSRDGVIAEVVPHTLSEFTKEIPSKELVKKDDETLRWVGASSVYFDAIARPMPTTQPMIPIGSIKAESLSPDAEAAFRDVITTLSSGELVLPPGQTGATSLNIFLGPKQRKLLHNSFYSQPTLAYQLTLTTNQGMCGNWCAWAPVINTLVAMLTFFHWVFGGFANHGDWGLAIMGLVIVVRLALHPITKRSTISMQKMGKMGPEVERLKKKYGDQKDELNKAMMQLYKEQGFTPVLGCLPMFLQTPIWIALYSSLQNTFELRQAPFLWGMTWIHDLARPDSFITFAQPLIVPILGWHIYSINLLPVLMAGVFFLQQKYQPKPVASTPEQAQQQKMMQWMSLLFPIFMYRMPSGLNLYILTSTSIGILESKRIRDHIKQREEAEKAGRVFVAPTRKMRRKGGDDNETPDAPKTGLAGWVARLQARAAEIQRDATKKQGRGR